MKKLFCFFIAALLFISFSRAQVNPPSVKIGSQTWMLKNLDVSKYRNGDPIPEVKDSATWDNLITGAWCYYKNDPANGKTYGKLYNWFAVNDSRGLAPKGWHIPSKEEWTTLNKYLWEVDEEEGELEVTSGKMKESGNAHWVSPNYGANNSSGFTGLPGGFRNIVGSFYDIGESGGWWSSTEFLPGWKELHPKDAWAWSCSMYYDDSYIHKNDIGKLSGFSVRCIKD